MTIGYISRRIGVFLLIVVVAVTINFIMPRLRSTNPIEQRLHQMAGQGGVYGAQLEELVKIYNQKFGLDKPIYVQYLNYWNDLLHLNLGQSLAFYPDLPHTTSQAFYVLSWTWMETYLR